MVIENILNAFAKFNLKDILDVFFLFLLIYYLLLLIKGTKSYQMALGLMLIGCCALLAELLKLTAFAFILNKFLTYLIFAIIILFQGELRKILAAIGSKLRTRFIPTEISLIRDEIVNAVMAMSLGKIGALIAIEKEIKLKSYIDKHIKLDALVSKDMLLTIFSPNTPLHDGAVIISEGRIAAANCFFPYPPLLELTPAGGRHLAAIGISQETDCITIVVSEQTGKISLAAKGELIRGLDREGLKNRLKFFKI
ncbi:MAG: diadenylate cyclase CdaA [Candidatus Aminicenantes bacterium]|nr:diadenylate cyclase CdaA [Candidatus Aminicenantes bacterium]